jgi:hypothetical protein
MVGGNAGVVSFAKVLSVEHQGLFVTYTEIDEKSSESIF